MISMKKEYEWPSWDIFIGFGGTADKELEVSFF